MRTLRIKEDMTPTICECGEVIETSAQEVLTFDSVECPNCGTDVYYTDGQYKEAYELRSSPWIKLN